MEADFQTIFLISIPRDSYTKGHFSPPPQKKAGCSLLSPRKNLSAMVRHVVSVHFRIQWLLWGVNPLVDWFDFNLLWRVRSCGHFETAADGMQRQHTVLADKASHVQRENSGPGKCQKVNARCPKSFLISSPKVPGKKLHICKHQAP